MVRGIRARWSRSERMACAATTVRSLWVGTCLDEALIFLVLSSKNILAGCRINEEKIEKSCPHEFGSGRLVFRAERVSWGCGSNLT